VFCLRDVYLDEKHMIRSCLDLVAIAIVGNTDSNVQDQLQDSPRNQKMSSAYWNWFDNVDEISNKYKLNNNGTKTLP
jgi:hypothetical protein